MPKRAMAGERLTRPGGHRGQAGYAAALGVRLAWMLGPLKHPLDVGDQAPFLSRE
jgi:hypothetical protein